jgi:hypothetical protein
MNALERYLVEKARRRQQFLKALNVLTPKQKTRKAELLAAMSPEDRALFKND